MKTEAKYAHRNLILRTWPSVCVGFVIVAGCGSRGGSGGGGEPQACGGPLGIGCSEGRFCKLDPGSCDLAEAIGECTPISDGCDDILQPVCGCDGITYPNDCSAYTAGVNIDHEGECAGEGKECGGALRIECDEGEFCKLEPGSCEEADAIGECIFSGDVCPDNLEPVCGCDGETYSNDCFAYVAGVNIDHDGECSCTTDADCCAAVDCDAEADNTVRAGCCDPLCDRTCIDGECVTVCE